MISIKNLRNKQLKKQSRKILNCPNGLGKARKNIFINKYVYTDTPKIHRMASDYSNLAKEALILRDTIENQQTLIYKNQLDEAIIPINDRYITIMEEKSDRYIRRNQSDGDVIPINKNDLSIIQENNTYISYKQSSKDLNETNQQFNILRNIIQQFTKSNIYKELPQYTISFHDSHKLSLHNFSKSNLVLVRHKIYTKKNDKELNEMPLKHFLELLNMSQPKNINSAQDLIEFLGEIQDKLKFLNDAQKEILNKFVVKDFNHSITRPFVINEIANNDNIICYMISITKDNATIIHSCKNNMIYTYKEDTVVPYYCVGRAVLSPDYLIKLHSSDRGFHRKALIALLGDIPDDFKVVNKEDFRKDFAQYKGFNFDNFDQLDKDTTFGRILDSMNNPYSTESDPIKFYNTNFIKSNDRIIYGLNVYKFYVQETMTLNHRQFHRNILITTVRAAHRKLLIPLLITIYNDDEIVDKENFNKALEQYKYFNSDNFNKLNKRITFRAILDSMNSPIAPVTIPSHDYTKIKREDFREIITQYKYFNFDNFNKLDTETTFGEILDSLNRPPKTIVRHLEIFYYKQSLPIKLFMKAQDHHITKITKIVHKQDIFIPVISANKYDLLYCANQELFILIKMINPDLYVDHILLYQIMPKEAFFSLYASLYFEINKSILNPIGTIIKSIELSNRQQLEVHCLLLKCMHNCYKTTLQEIVRNRQSKEQNVINYKKIENGLQLLKMADEDSQKDDATNQIINTQDQASQLLGKKLIKPIKRKKNDDEIRKHYLQYGTKALSKSNASLLIRQNSNFQKFGLYLLEQYYSTIDKYLSSGAIQDINKWRGEKFIPFAEENGCAGIKRFHSGQECGEYKFTKSDAGSHARIMIIKNPLSSVIWKGAGYSICIKNK